MTLTFYHSILKSAERIPSTSAWIISILVRVLFVVWNLPQPELASAGCESVWKILQSAVCVKLWFLIHLHKWLFHEGSALMQSVNSRWIYSHKDAGHRRPETTMLQMPELVDQVIGKLLYMRIEPIRISSELTFTKAGRCLNFSLPYFILNRNLILLSFINYIYQLWIWFLFLEYLKSNCQTGLNKRLLLSFEEFYQLLHNYKIDFKMSVYGGFATRALEMSYGRIVENLIFTLQKRVV